jgi:hypothetical protein
MTHAIKMLSIATSGTYIQHGSLIELVKTALGRFCSQIVTDDTGVTSSRYLNIMHLFWSAACRINP